MALLAGQSVGLIHEIRPAADVVRELVDGVERLIRELSVRAAPPVKSAGVKITV